MKALLLLAALSAQAAAMQISHHDAEGRPVTVTVLNDRCPDGIAQGCYLQHVVWLGGNNFNLAHELAHVAGMKHGPWFYNSFGIPCARVTVAGYATGYEVGQLICNGLRGEWVER